MKDLTTIWLACVLISTAVARADSNTSARSDGNALVPATLIEIPAAVDDVLIADAAAAELIRFSRAKGRLVESDRRYMSVGRNGVGKQRAWDRKTPLGVYFLTEELDTSRLAAKYGKAAYVLDYPNAWDRYNDRTGDGIWLHGVDPRAPNRPRRDTDGCLALPNEELLSLSDRLVLHDTPVIISRQIEWVSAAEVSLTREALRDALERWRASVEQGDLHAYLALYDEDFSTRGMTKEQWGSFKLGAFAARPIENASLSQVFLLGDPEVENLYVSRFTLTTTAQSETITIRKRLYWRRDGSDWFIVSEGAG